MPTQLPDQVPPAPQFNELSVLVPLLAIYTTAYLVMLAADFLLRAALDVPPGLMPVYLALLGAYVADKEFRRWTGRPDRPRKGAAFVYLWALLFLTCFIVNTFRPDFPLPGELAKLTLQVIGIFAGTRASKALHGRRTQKSAEPEKLAQLLSLVAERKQITRAEAESRLGVSKATANRLLQTLVAQGQLEKRGTGHEVYYARKS